MMAFAACGLLLAAACGKESKTAGNLKPSRENLTGQWQFDQYLSGDFMQSRITFRKGKDLVKDSLYFSAHPGRGFIWELNGNVVEGTRYLDGYHRESVRMLIRELSSNMYVDAATADTTWDTTMVVKGYFTETTLGYFDTVWNFRGNLKKL